jgi:proteasome lid subunit RPN8/RPN11
MNLLMYLCLLHKKSRCLEIVSVGTVHSTEEYYVLKCPEGESLHTFEAAEKIAHDYAVKHNLTYTPKPAY